MLLDSTAPVCASAASTWLTAGHPPLGLQVHHTSLLLLEASHAAVIISQTECQNVIYI